MQYWMRAENDISIAHDVSSLGVISGVISNKYSPKEVRQNVPGAYMYIAQIDSEDPLTAFQFLQQRKTLFEGIDFSAIGIMLKELRIVNQLKRGRKLVEIADSSQIWVIAKMDVGEEKHLANAFFEAGADALYLFSGDDLNVEQTVDRFQEIKKIRDTSLYKTRLIFDIPSVQYHPDFAFDAEADIMCASELSYKKLFL